MWRSNQSTGITILGVTKEEALEIIERAFARKAKADANRENSVKVHIQIFERVNEE